MPDKEPRAVYCETQRDNFFVCFRTAHNQSVRPHGTIELPLDEFDNIWRSSFLSQKYVKKIQVSLKYGKNNGYFTWKTFFTFMTISR